MLAFHIHDLQSGIRQCLQRRRSLRRIPPPKCNESAVIHPCPEHGSNLRCFIKVIRPTMTFQVKMPRCGDSYRDVDHNITFRASGCTGLNMQHPATLTVELATCQYKMPAPQCRGTITLPICKKPKPILYEASRNTHKLLGERVRLVTHAPHARTHARTHARKFASCI